MTLEGAEGRIWCSKIGWQTVPCSWSIDGEAALTGSSPARGTSRVPDAVERTVAGDPAQSGPAHTRQPVPDSEGLHHVDTSTQGLPSCRHHPAAYIT